jgi:hypothetical protein
MLFHRIAIWYVAVSTFLFFLPASRSLFNREYQWASGYFFRTDHGSYSGLEGFLPALIPFLIGAVILLYGRRGMPGTFAALAMAWAGFQLLNQLLLEGPSTFRGDTFQIAWTSVLLNVIFWGWPLLVIVLGIWELRKGEFGWRLQPLSKTGWGLLMTAILLSGIIGYLERSGPMESLANKYAVVFTLVQYILLMFALKLGSVQLRRR